MFRFSLFIIASILIVAWFGGQDVKRCVEHGHSEAVCLATLNP